ncbi:peptidoglycan editing factor PgeF [Shewanella glacialipiscicola]|uniref:Purine nucleoside phosphorylase n=1 Tax=Shewanella glacialipiscicola TaxID=614069 RepID=A0ABQ6J6H9_9GAMM|nr:peptidoglycan editing factor PgeF [Shewanella glacialipiscicola]MCL1086877.1 peptidoglycan editing factor PgeF [Shewanella glacialipiscicola]GIU13046.1 laccase domain protein [Shewanella glacialipiscicola]GMA83088.1 laccase domain protein [Shewanella glacialipiscicola]
MLHHDWPVPANVGIAMTNRHGGVSTHPFDSLNLGLHVGDAIERVMANRELLSKQLTLAADPVWLEQVHGTHVLNLDTLTLVSPRLANQSLANASADKLIADASYSRTVRRVCAIMTADCLPVLLCNQAGTEVAAAHAGWRGLCDGVIEATAAQFSSPMNELIAYLGPAIGPQKFEVGAEVKQAFCALHPQAAACFIPNGDKYLANIVSLAKLRLSLLGVSHIYSADICTITDTNYFSYRRDKVTGRMASLIWLKS